MAWHCLSLTKVRVCCSAAASRQGYILSLPKREYVPIFWSEEELELLEGTELEGRTERER